MGSSPPAEESVSDLVESLTRDLRQLVTDELQLAKSEAKDTLRRGLRALIGLALAILGLSLMVPFALVTLVEWIPNHTLVAGLIAAVGLLMVGAGGAVVFANRRLIPLVLTRKTVQEDLEWARLQTRRTHR